MHTRPPPETDRLIYIYIYYFFLFQSRVRTHYRHHSYVGGKILYIKWKKNCFFVHKLRRRLLTDGFGIVYLYNIHNMI